MKKTQLITVKPCDDGIPAASEDEMMSKTNEVLKRLTLEMLRLLISVR